MTTTTIKEGHEINGDEITFWEIVPDEASECPLEWGTNGKIYHAKSDMRGDIGNLEKVYPRELSEILEKNEFAVPLSYYEHSAVSWFVVGTKNAPDMKWDGIRLAGVWVPENIKVRDKKHAIEYAEAVCEDFSNWCNGYVYGYISRTYELITHENEPVTSENVYGQHIREDSCFGYYSLDFAVEEAKV